MHTGDENTGTATKIQKRLQEDEKMMMEEFGLNEESRIEKDKTSPKCKQYHRRCPQGQSPWETLLRDFKERVQEDKESPIGK